MIVDTINACISMIQKKDCAEKKRISEQQYERNLNSVKTTTEWIEKIFDIDEAITENKITTESCISVDLQTDLLESILSCGNAIRDYSLGKEQATIFDTQVKRANQALATHWQKWALDYSNGVSGYLSLLIGLTIDPRRSQELQNLVRLGCSTIPSHKEVDMFVKNVSEIQKIVDYFSLDDKIKDFLIKVRFKDATIEDLTPEVICWLEKNNLKKKLLINF
jgi:hypothetical protein